MWPSLFPEPRGKTSSYSFPVQAHLFLQLLLFLLLFQTLLLFSPLPLPMRDVLSGWSGGAKLGSQNLGKGGVTRPVSSQRAELSWRAEGRSSCTRKASVSAVSHLPPC